MFKDRLREARKACGYTQESLAEKIGVKKSTVNGYEKGNSEPDMQKLIAIMKLLRVDANYLYQDEMSNGESPTLSDAATEIAINFDALSAVGKELVCAVMDFALKHHKALDESFLTGKTIIAPGGKVLPTIKMSDDAEFAARHWAREEQKELVNETTPAPSE